METKDLIRMEEEFENKTKEYEEYKSHIENLELQHVHEAKKIIDKLLLEAYLKAEDKEKFLEQVEAYYREWVWHGYYNPMGTLPGPYLRPTINLFEYFFENDSSFRRFYGVDNEINWSQVFPGDKRLECFKKDLCKLFLSSLIDIKWSEYEKNNLFSLVGTDLIQLIEEVDVHTMEQISYASRYQFHFNYNSSHDNHRDNLGVKKYIESLNSELVFSNNQEQEETVESISSENSELQQQIAKIKKSHFPDEYKAQLIAELEQGDSQRGDGRTSGRSI